jgi:hypothetical protein
MFPATRAPAPRRQDFFRKDLRFIFLMDSSPDINLHRITYYAAFRATALQHLSPLIAET